jgi:hypothetical protein
MDQKANAWALTDFILELQHSDEGLAVLELTFSARNAQASDRASH